MGMIINPTCTHISFMMQVDFLFAACPFKFGGKCRNLAAIDSNFNRLFAFGFAILD